MDANTLRLLIVEDSDDDLLLIKATLEQAGYRVVHRQARNEAEMREALGQPWDFVISDHGLPGFDSLVALDLARRYQPDTPFIIVSGYIDETLAIQSMRRGSRDYVFKDRLERLVVVIDRELRNRRGNTHDLLTGLINRNSFHERLVMQLAENGEHRPMGLVMLDIDRFRTINEGLGYARADRLLALAGERLLRYARGNLVARLGGDEFALIIPDVATVEELERCAGHIHALFREPFTVDGHPLRITTSVGASLLYQDAAGVSDLQTNAERAMYHAKNRGGDQYCCFQAEMATSALEAIRIEHDLHGALRKGELHVEYQPQISVETRRVVGVEALLRWHHPDLGLIAPARFIPVAEASGLIVDIGRWVLRQACRQAAAWQAAGMTPLRMAVNLSARQFRDSNVVGDVRDVLDETGLAPGLLELEITEGTLMESTVDSIQVLDSLRQLGVQIAVDDFGTGYSSLAYLKRFPIDALKIDRGFIADMDSQGDGFALVHAIVGLGQTLGLRTVAEGVEQTRQYQGLQQLGCDEAQGFLFARPARAQVMEPWLHSTLAS